MANKNMTERQESFPHYDNYEPEEKKEPREAALPLIAGFASNEVVKNYLRAAEAFPPTTEEELRRVAALKKFDSRIFGMQLIKEGVSGKELAILALLDEAEDIITQESETLSDSRTQQKATSTMRDFLALHRDRLLEKLPELRRAYTKKDFEDWLRSIMRSNEQSQTRKIDTSDEGLKNRIKASTEKEYKALDRYFSGAPLLEDDYKEIYRLLDDDIRSARSPTTEEIINFILGEEYDDQALLKFEADILKMRQFRANLESGDWANKQ